MSETHRTLYAWHTKPSRPSEENRTVKAKAWNGNTGRTKMLDKTQIVESLHQGICEVVFTKTDGTERTMRCTRSKSHAPIVETRLLNEDGSAPDLIPVWDLDANHWRSFHASTVKSFRRVGTLLNG